MIFLEFGVRMNNFLLILQESQALLTEDLFRKISLEKIPQGAWTVAGAIVAACIALGGVRLTQITNLKMQEAQFNHQIEMTKMQHFLDKRTDVFLQFQQLIEEVLDLQEFVLRPSGLNREMFTRMSFKIKPLSKFEHNNFKDVRDENVSTTIDFGLQTLIPLEEKLKELKNSFNLVVIYLTDEETSRVRDMLNSIAYSTGLKMRTLNNLKKRTFYNKDSRDFNDLIDMIIIANDEQLDNISKFENEKEIIRKIMKRYLYVDSLDK